MKNKKIFFLLFCVLIIILVFLFFITKQFKKNIVSNETADFEEYTPEEEISSKQLRETVVTLYFPTVDGSELQSEGKLIDSAILLLLAGTASENLTKVFPENTKILDASFTSNCVTLNFSDDILKFSDDTQKFNIINCLLNTLSGLNEVNSVKILVNNEPNENFSDEYSTTQSVN